MHARARAPGVVKLLGEHAVLYGATSLAVAVGLYASADLSEGGGSGLRITLQDLGYSREFSAQELREQLAAYRLASGSDAGLGAYAGNARIDSTKALGYAIIAGRMQEDHGADLGGTEVKISSEIPRGSGCASSAACFTAFATALASTLKSKLDDQTIIDIARDGERVTHKMTKAGGIDVSTSYLGGFVTSGNGKHNRLDVRTRPPLLLMNTGPKRETWEMIAHVARLKNEDPENTDPIIREVGERSESGIAALLRDDLPALGREMTRTHGAFKRLGISTPRLDEAVEIALENEAYGAKLSGGGGGGVAVAIMPEGPVDAELKDRGFEALRPGISELGARDLLAKD